MGGYHPRMQPSPSSSPENSTPANRLGLDYHAEAAELGRPPVPIIDVHAHINGAQAAHIYGNVCDAYGIRLTYSQSQLAQADAVREVLGDRIRFLAIPEYMAEDRGHAMREGFLENIQAFHDRFNARMVKFWAAPRFRDFIDPVADADLLGYDNEWRIRAAELAESLGMMFMTHVGDPDTWFQAKYSDASVYGTKADQYVGFERMLDRFTCPWIAAHMGGWPEDLDFLTGLLGRHDNLHLDTSATKWMVRELSKHDSARFAEFLEQWKGRILFGSDIVTSDDHLKPTDPDNEKFGVHLADSEEAAFDLYASRYWALRTMFETTYEGESPIADPDLEMVDPTTYGSMSAPTLRGHSLSEDLLQSIYAGAAENVVVAWEQRATSH